VSISSDNTEREMKERATKTSGTNFFRLNSKRPFKSSIKEETEKVKTINLTGPIE